MYDHHTKYLKNPKSLSETFPHAKNVGKSKESHGYKIMFPPSVRISLLQSCRNLNDKKNHESFCSSFA